MVKELLVGVGEEEGGLPFVVTCAKKLGGIRNVAQSAFLTASQYLHGQVIAVRFLP